MINSVKLSNGHYVTNPKEIANAFNNYFVNVGKEVQNGIGHEEKYALDYLTEIDDIFEFNEALIQKVTNLLKNYPRERGVDQMIHLLNSFMKYYQT